MYSSFMQLEKLSKKTGPFWSLFYPLVAIPATQSALLAFGRIEQYLGQLVSQP
jgi:hypothetical protein